MILKNGSRRSDNTCWLRYALSLYSASEKKRTDGG